jgi:hypothetical protein
VKGVVEDAVADRAAGGRPGRIRSIVAAIVAGFGCAMLAYRLLRSGNDRIDYSTSKEG